VSVDVGTKIMTKHLLTIAILMEMLASASSAGSDTMPLVDARMDLSALPAREALEYNIVAFSESEEPIDYGTLVLDTTVEGGVITLMDTMSTSPSLPRFAGVTFRRQLRFPTNDLLRPISVTLDVESGTNIVREMSWSNGVMTVYGRGDESFAFDQGILTYNAMLRIARCLRVSDPSRFTVEQYAEPILFRVRKAKEPGDAVLSIGPHTGVGEDEPDCVFRLLSAKIHTEIWLDEDSLPATILEHIPGGDRLVYTLSTKKVPTRGSTRTGDPLRGSPSGQP